MDFRPFNHGVACWQADDGRVSAIQLGTMLYTGESEGSGIVRTRLSLIPVELVLIDRQRKLWLDLLQFARHMPSVVSRLLHRREALHRLARPPEVFLSAEEFNEWKEKLPSAGSPATRGRGLNMFTPDSFRPLEGGLPEVVRMSFHFTDAVVELVGHGDSVERRLVAQADRLCDLALRTPPCFLASVSAGGARHVTAADLDAEALARLRKAMDAEAPGSFDALTEGKVEPYEVTWGQPDWRVVLAVSNQLFDEGVEATGLSLFMSRIVREDLDLRRLAAEEQRVAVEVFNLWAITERRSGRLERAFMLLDKALKVASEPRSRQALLYNRGYARLQTTMVELREELASNGLNEALFRNPAHKLDVQDWERALEDFEQAVRLDPKDQYAWSQIAMTCLLLGAANDFHRIGRRIARLERALDAIQKWGELSDPEHHASVDKMRARVKNALQRLSEVPFWVRLLGYTHAIPWSTG